VAGPLGRPGARAAAAGPACRREPRCWTRCWCSDVGRWHGAGRSAGRAGAPPARARRVRPAAPPTSLPRCAATSRCPSPCALCRSPRPWPPSLAAHSPPFTRRRSLAAVHRCQAAQAGAVHLAGGERAPGEGGRRGADVRAQLARAHRALVRADELGAALQVRHRPRRVVPREALPRSGSSPSRSPWRPTCSRSPRPRTPPPPAPLRPARPQRQPQTGAPSSAPGCAARFKTR